MAVMMEEYILVFYTFCRISEGILANIYIYFHEHLVFSFSSLYNIIKNPSDNAIRKFTDIV